MCIKSLDGTDTPYKQFLNALTAKGFTPLPEKTVILRFNGREDPQKQIISGKAFYKDLGKGFGAVAEYTGECCALYIIRGMGE